LYPFSRFSGATAGQALGDINMVLRRSYTTVTVMLRINSGNQCS
jgi:hypothetical protein